MDCKNKKASQLRLAFRGSPNWARTSDIMINSHALYRLSYGGIYKCWRLPIFTGRFQPTIFGTTELNFCVRDGNRWTLSVIDTNYLLPLFSFQGLGDPCENRTRVAAVRGRSLNRLTNGPILFGQSRLPSSNLFFGAPSGVRTRDTLIKSQVLYQLS